jgi:hypothetical protein
MPTDHQISVLIDIARSGGAGLRAERLVDVLELIANGYIEASMTAGRDYDLTAEGQGVLDDRGVDAHES